MSSLTIATSQGPTQWVALPVFTTREFFHLRILVRVASGIEKPADLKGKRVGVPEYQQTAAIWGRGVLQHEFGVHPRDIEWHMERTPETSHGGSTGFKPPEGVTVHRIPLDHQHRRDDGEAASLTRRCSISPTTTSSTAAASTCPRRPLPAAVRPQGRRPALFRQDRHLPDQPRHGDPPLDPSSAIRGPRSTSTTPSPRRAPRCCAPATTRCTAITSRA